MSSLTNRSLWGRDMYLGLFSLDSEMNAAIDIAIANVPLDPTNAPTYRVYEADTLVPGGTGSLTKMDTGSITGATNATPIVITSTTHGLETGNRVTISGVLGNTAANGTWTITKVNANSFSLDTSVGNGAYTSGGTWHITGLYLLTLTLSLAASYEVGKTYQVRIDFSNGGTGYSKTVYFAVT